MNIKKAEKYSIKINTNDNNKRSIEEQKNDNNNHERICAKISLVKNTKKNFSKLQQMLNKRSNTPRINKIPKLDYKDNVT